MSCLTTFETCAGITVVFSCTSSSMGHLHTDLFTHEVPFVILRYTLSRSINCFKFLFMMLHVVLIQTEITYDKTITKPAGTDHELSHTLTHNMRDTL